MANTSIHPHIEDASSAALAEDKGLEEARVSVAPEVEGERRNLLRPSLKDGRLLPTRLPTLPLG